MTPPHPHTPTPLLPTTRTLRTHPTLAGCILCHPCRLGGEGVENETPSAEYAGVPRISPHNHTSNQQSLSQKVEILVSKGPPET